MTCTYRAVTRTRRAGIQSPLHRSEPVEERTRPCASIPGSSRNEEIYHSVSATQASARSSPLQLYYGPSSQFAFLQQIHRGILSDEAPPRTTTVGQVQDVSSGLEMFLQRGFFFGTGMLGNPVAPNETSELREILPLDLAIGFLDHYMACLYPISPLLHELELRPLVSSLCNAEIAQAPKPQLKAIILTVLAIGASCTEDIILADILYSKAKIEAVSFDETVNLHAVQLSILLGIYQANLERSNSAYLHFGTACRKAFAMGLHVDVPLGGDLGSGTQQQRRIAIWCLYWLESWHSLAMGRKSAITSSDISCQLPAGDLLICTLARLSAIMTRSADAIYNHQLDSTWEVYKAADKIYSELRQFAEEHKIGPASRDDEASQRSMELLYLNNLYYHTVLLTFRPFLIVRASQTEKSHRRDDNQNGSTTPAGNEMWLRQACRHAVDAAQDQITILCGRMETIQIIKRVRYYCFFIESSCGILLYDILCQKSKLQLNLEYIHTALRCLSEMVSGEPASNAISSIKQMLSVVEQKVLSRGAIQLNHTLNICGPHGEGPVEPLGANDQSTAGNLNDYRPNNFPPMPSLTTHNMIHMRDRSDDSQNDILPIDFNFDIFTTNLYHYFPMESGLSQENT